MNSDRKNERNKRFSIFIYTCDRECNISTFWFVTLILRKIPLSAPRIRDKRETMLEREWGGKLGESGRENCGVPVCSSKPVAISKTDTALTNN